MRRPYIVFLPVTVLLLLVLPTVLSEFAVVEHQVTQVYFSDAEKSAEEATGRASDMERWSAEHRSAITPILRRGATLQAGQSQPFRHAPAGRHEWFNTVHPAVWGGGVCHGACAVIMAAPDFRPVPENKESKSWPIREYAVVPESGADVVAKAVQRTPLRHKAESEDVAELRHVYC